MIQLNITTLTELCLFFGTYGASKSYVLNSSEALAKKMEDYHVVVTCLSPGPTDTNFFENSKFGDKKKGHFSNTGRMKSREVAAIGINALFAKKLSIISGMKNSFLAFTNRLAPRSISPTFQKK